MAQKSTIVEYWKRMAEERLLQVHEERERALEAEKDLAEAIELLEYILGEDVLSSQARQHVRTFFATLRTHEREV